MGLLDRVAAARSGVEQRSSIDTWISDYLLPSQFSYGGTAYPLGGLAQTLVGARVQEISATLPGYMAALRTCPPAFGAQMVRALVLSQARFAWRRFRNRTTFGTSSLQVLERPWNNATTGQMLARMEWHAGLAGNAFVTRQPGRLRVLRPDWVAIVFGSNQEPEDAATALDGEIIGYAYLNGGFAAAGRNDVHTLLPADVAHWSPLPDPENAELGMSWITPAIRDIQGDRAATDHKLAFFTNGATPNMVIKGIQAPDRQKFEAIVDMLEEAHAGVRNAYKTWYLTAGVDATVVGKDLQQVDFKATQGAGETRISVLSRVPAPLLGISEGLAGSSLNAGNFGMARRMFADTWVYPTLMDAAASLAPLVDPPRNPATGQPDSELWFDVTDMPLLREDAKDAAEIVQIQASTIAALVKEGFTADSATAAVMGQDMTLLQHTGLVSVQLQPPGGPASLAPEAAAARNVVEMIQKIYLGVDKVISEDEARELLNQAGANLPIPAPGGPPALQPSLPAPIPAPA